MAGQAERPLYAHLQYEVLHKLDITIAEYFYLDMIYQLSHDKWCYKSLENIALDMKMNRMGVYKMRNRLIERGILKKNLRGHVKTTDTYNKVILTTKPAYNSVSNRITKLYPDVSLSYTKNNNEINKEKKTSDFGGRGEPSPNKEKIRIWLKQKKQYES